MRTTAAEYRTLALVSPKATGTQGDTLVAWGLAIFASEALRDSRVILSDRGDHFLIETGVSYEMLEQQLATFTWRDRLARSRLRWLESQVAGRMPRADSPFAATDYEAARVDRDELREAHRLWRARRREMRQPADTPGDGPVLTTTADPELYPFYEVLTNPGTQWIGYNTFVELLYARLTPDDVRALLATYAVRAEHDDTPVRQVRGAPGHTGMPSRNPPGFLYPGMNKGPTMRVTDEQGRTVGAATAPDWTLADREDRSLFELYLAYIGYFAVARVVTTKELRVVAVPIPARVRIRSILGNLPARELEATNLTDYLAAQSALDYGHSALRYLADLQGDSATVLQQRGMALRGAHLSVFWRPNGNVFAPSRLAQVSLPIWLAALREQSQDMADATLRLHQDRLRSVRGHWRDEKKLSPEQRTATPPICAHSMATCSVGSGQYRRGSRPRGRQHLSPRQYGTWRPSAPASSLARWSMTPCGSEVRTRAQFVLGTTLPGSRRRPHGSSPRRSGTATSARRSPPLPRSNPRGRRTPSPSWRRRSAICAVNGLGWATTPHGRRRAIRSAAA